MGDSGWVYFEIDGESEDNEYTQALVNYMYDYLDYGSWAGEFTAQGEADYNPETKSFEGTDYYGEDSHHTINELDLHIKVPKKFWFDTLHVECDVSGDDVPSISVRFIIKNGFLTSQHTDFCSNLETDLQKEFGEIFNDVPLPDGEEFRGCTDSFILDRSQATEVGDDLLFTIHQVEIQTSVTEDKPVYLELDEENAGIIDDNLNDEENGN